MTQFDEVRFPGWEVTRKLGEGSFGAVYEIRRTLPDGRVEACALKKLTVPKSPDEIEELYAQSFDKDSITTYFRSQMSDLVSEYSLMQSLSGCPNIVNCHDIRYIQHDDDIGWDIYIRMELLYPLKRVLGSGFSEDVVCNLGMQLCNALAACHAENIIHRDIKPENILVSGKGVFKLGDFGVAKISERTGTGTLTGSYGYMAPEVASHRHYGAQADIYSLGMVLYWMMNRRTLPFLPLPPDIPTGVQRQQAQDRRLSGEPLPPPADGSEALKRVVLKACAFSPAERYRSAEELRLALQDCLHTPAAPQTPQPMTPPAPITEPTVMDTSTEPEYESATQAVIPPQRPAEKKAPEKEKRKSKGWLWAALGVLLLCCCVGIFGYMHCWFGHVWQAEDCTTGRICTRCSAVAAEPLGHVWKAATCTTPKTCSLCGETEGTALGHSWEAATCTSPKTCSRCNKTEGTALGHSWKAATCTLPKTCSLCGETEGIALGHTWETATCTAPKTCSLCGETEGIALGHSWEAATCTSPKTCSLCDETEGIALGHAWETATCTSPKTCSLCGKTEGIALGHTWKSATCTSPKTCSRCNKTEGTALGHTWKSATCTSPKTCSRCNKTEGTALGHSWKSATCTSPKTCSRCNKTEGTALGHSWRAATCTSPKTCTRCHATTGAALGHKWRAATYDAPKTCTVCGATTGTALKRTPSVEAGDIVTFGKYEQDNNKSNGAEAIRWIVLDVQDDRALLLSRYALDSVRYHSSYVDVGWRDCSLRSWLNDTFLYTAFSAEDRRRIVTTYDTGASDSVFLLSVGEVYYYLSSARDRTCSLTSYAAAMGAAEKNNVAQWWWTRSPGTEAGQTTFINFEGDSYSAYVNNYSLAVRPAIWISLN